MKPVHVMEKLPSGLIFAVSSSSSGSTLVSLSNFEWQSKWHSATTRMWARCIAMDFYVRASFIYVCAALSFSVSLSLSHSLSLTLPPSVCLPTLAEKINVEIDALRKALRNSQMEVAQLKAQLGACQEDLVQEQAVSNLLQDELEKARESARPKEVEGPESGAADPEPEVVVENRGSAQIMMDQNSGAGSEAAAATKAAATTAEGVNLSLGGFVGTEAGGSGGKA